MPENQKDLDNTSAAPRNPESTAQEEVDHASQPIPQARNAKDIVGKNLEGENDVFADILNVLVLDEDEQLDINNVNLTDETPRAMFKIDGGIHENERDVVKTLNGTAIQIITIGLENQIDVEKYMAVRIFGYDGLMYTKQFLRVNDSQDSTKTIHPVMTFVLYFGDNHSYEGTYSLLDSLDMDDVPKSMKKYLKENCDYKYTVFNIPNMTAEQVEKFQSDFREVADFFSQKRHTGMYVPNKRPIRHADKLLKTMQVLCKDDRYELALGKEVKNMCDVIDFYENKGMSTLQSNLQRAVKYLKANNRNDEIEKLITEPEFLETILQKIDENKKTGA